MKLRLGYTLQQLLEVYGKEADVPKILAGEEVGIYGLEFWVDFRKEEPWIDEKVKEYLGTELFLRDLQTAEEIWQERSKCNNYWLKLTASSTRAVRLFVDVEKKVF